MKNIKRFFTIVSLIVLPLAFVMITQNRVDHNTLRIQGFYQEDKDSIDAVFIGSSEVFTGYSPAYAYGKCGFTSYNISVESNRLEFFESQIKEALNYQDPKLIVIEISDSVIEWDESDKASFIATLRKYTDSMPVSQNKIETVNTFADDEKLSFYLPFIMYHGQLSNIGGTQTSVSQALRGTTYLKGAISTNHKQDFQELIDIKDDVSGETISAKLQERLERLLSFCKTLDCEVLFTAFPRRITDSSSYLKYRQRNTVGKIIQDNGFDFISFEQLSDEMRIDPLSDYYDNDHLNAFGQMKFTEYCGNVIKDKYNLLPQEQLCSNNEKWEKAYQYINLFYEYNKIHENDPEEWWYEKPELIRELEELENNSMDYKIDNT